MLATIHVHVGAKTKKLKLKLPTIIGRGGSSKIKLPASTVSRQHCEIYEYEGNVAIRYLGSSNGTHVNGHRITEPTFVGPDDVLKVGPLVFSVKPFADEAKPTAEPVVEETPAVEPPKKEAPAIVTADEAQVDVEAPTFEELPAATEEPVSSKSIPIDVVPMEDDEDDASVLQYAAPKDEGGRSFVGIQELGDGVTQPAAESSVPAFDGEEVKESVESDESALQDFFKNLE